MAHSTKPAPARAVGDQARPQASAPGAQLTGVVWMAAAVSAISALLCGYDTRIISAPCCRSAASSIPEGRDGAGDCR